MKSPLQVNGRARQSVPDELLNAPYGVSSGKDAVDQLCYGLVQISFAIITRIMRMGCCRIAQYTDNFMFGQDVAIIQR